ncbi:MAG: hypothetical protein COB20_09330 [SAR86 cluster bacterium]|uniref:Copper resistance protein D n=1 Tax=SAR86 cluster bacterium TaxID=2030880 RepID=A0A2A4X326_9GAMM|nr:MAG: hypothetical protein COB20_09330 [SAR86 cluster bacterium]
MGWTLFSVASKVLYLAGIAAVFGGALAYLLLCRTSFGSTRSIVYYIASGALLGLFGSASFFLAQVGSINDVGILGMLDSSMVRMLADSSLGSASMVRAMGLFLGLILVLIIVRDSKQQLRTAANLVVMACLLALVGLFFARSVTLTGHVSTLDLVARVVLGIHVATVLGWIGSLWPLWLICRSENVSSLQKIMTAYGQIAVYVVVGLTASGLWLAWQLLNSFSDLFFTSYGRLLLLKLFGVSLLLLIAARHKLKLVPRLAHDDGVNRLRQSICMETAVAVLVLVVTATLTTAIGPESEH